MASVIGSISGMTQASRADDSSEFFELRVRPILAEHCYECHTGSDAARGLRLDSPSGFRTDDGQGMVVIPGDANKSRLILSIEHHTSSTPMPPDKKLRDNEIADLRQWVTSGASWPDAGPQDDSGLNLIDHWAFQSPKRARALQVSNERWNRTYVDRWIATQLKANQLEPSQRASPTELARRLAFDLMGLPPSPEIVQRLIESQENESEHLEAIREIVDEFLDSTEFGQHWGRHWLDTARYSEIMGNDILNDNLDTNPHAYTYRNWVIDAFNRDLPYDDFIRLQISADKIVEPNSPDLAALGFLTIGNKFEGDEPNTIDDRLDAIFRGVQGLSISCARCHDHKYDPISTAEYYSLYATFSEATEKEVPIFSTDEDREAFQVFASRLRKAVNDFEDFKRATRLEKYKQPHEQIAEYLLAIQQNKEEIADEQGWRPDGLHESVLNKIRESIADTKNYHHDFLWVWNELSQKSPEEFEAASRDIVQRAKLYLKVARDGQEMSEEEAIEDIYDKPFNFRLAEALVAQPPHTLAELAAIYGEICRQASRSWLQILADAKMNDTDPPERLPDDEDNEIRDLLFAKYPTFDLSEDDLKNALDEEPRKTYDALSDAITQVRMDPTAPPHARILVDGNPEREQYVFIRGKTDRPGERVYPQFLRVLEPDADPFDMGSARVELAESLCNPNNPLTARVWVNRVWAYLFGRGIVSSTSDFGTRGEPPSHPELLDSLALEFMRQGWSTKQLIRRIVLSEAYLQSSHDRDEARKKDPENRLLWRMNRKRLTREALRDALLAVSDQLDITPVGQSLPTEALNDDPKRTVYFTIHRRQLDAMARDFDMANPMLHAPSRHETTVPQQALFFLNNELVIEAARQIADQLWNDGDPGQSVVELYQRILGREPTEDESKVCESFFEQASREPSRGPLSVRTAWRYGYANYSPKSKRIEDFREFEHNEDGRWQISESFPDPDAGPISLTAQGGHPGHDAKRVVVLKWIAPIVARISGASPPDTTAQHTTAQQSDSLDRINISIEGSLHHETEDQSDEMDGIACAILHNDDNVLKRLSVRFGSKDFELDSISVQPGDSIQFVVHGRKNFESDDFRWEIRIKSHSRDDETGSFEYDMADNFRSESLRIFEPLSAGAQLAQILLMSNEFLYVD